MQTLGPWQPLRVNNRNSFFFTDKRHLEHKVVDHQCRADGGIVSPNINVDTRSLLVVVLRVLRTCRVGPMYITLSKDY